MLVLHVITDLNRGGAEMMLHRLIQAHRDHPQVRHRVISLRSTGSVGADLMSMGIEVDCLAMSKSPSGMFHAVRALADVIRRVQPDLIQTWMYHSDLIGGLAGRFAKHRGVIWGVRVTELSAAMGVPRSTTIIRHVCALLSRSLPCQIVYVAESARRAHEKLGYDYRKSVVIHNGYRIPSCLERDAARVRRRLELGLDETHVLIGSAGRYSPQKGFRGFTTAAAEVAKRCPQARFIIVGRDVGWENEELAGWVRGTGFADRFYLLGERSEILEWLAAMDLFTLNSIGEGFPNVVAEAMSVGVPCVVTNVGDAALLVNDTGMVVETGDGEALANAMLALASNDQHRRRLGAAARHRIASHFTIELIAERYAELYQTLFPIQEVSRERAEG